MHDLAEWIRRRAQFETDQLWPVRDPLPEAILERLAALADAEQRRATEDTNERRPKREPGGHR